MTWRVGDAKRWEDLFFSVRLHVHWISASYLYLHQVVDLRQKTSAEECSRWQMYESAWRYDHTKAAVATWKSRECAVKHGWFLAHLQNCGVWIFYSFGEVCRAACSWVCFNGLVLSLRTKQYLHWYTDTVHCDPLWTYTDTYTKYTGSLYWRRVTKTAIYKEEQLQILA